METERFESTCSFRPKRKRFMTYHTLETVQRSISYLEYKIQKTSFNFRGEFILKAYSQNNFLLLGGKCLAG